MNGKKRLLGAGLGILAAVLLLAAGCSGHKRNSASNDGGSGSGGFDFLGSKVETVEDVLQVTLPGSWASETNSGFKGIVLGPDSPDLFEDLPETARIEIVYVTDPSAALNAQEVLSAKVSAATKVAGHRSAGVMPDKREVLEPIHKVMYGSGIQGYETTVHETFSAKAMTGRYIALYDTPSANGKLILMTLLASDSEGTSTNPGKPFGVLLAILSSAKFK